MQEWSDIKSRDLGDLVLDALHKRDQAKLEVRGEKTFELPRLALMSKILPADDGRIPKSVPVIPPKQLTVNPYAINDFDEKPTWFFVQSPREIYGPVGPFSVPNLKTMYKFGDIRDTTMLWQEGQPGWLQLTQIKELRYKVIQIPDVPSREETYYGTNEEFDPIKDPLLLELAAKRKNLHEYKASKPCNRCGGVAESYIPISLVEKTYMPDLAGLRTAVGSTKIAAEVIPGYLWIGSKETAKASVIHQMGFSMIINVAAELHNPSAKPPLYRCREIRPSSDGLEEFPSDDGDDESQLSPAFVSKVFKVFDQMFDWIEWERVAPERNVESDPKLPPYRGPTDELGRPTQEHNPLGLPQKTPAQRLAEMLNRPPSRTLVWSKQGLNRAPAVVAAYLIRQWGLSFDAAMKVITRNRELATGNQWPYLSIEFVQIVSRDPKPRISLELTRFLTPTTTKLFPFPVCLLASVVSVCLSFCLYHQCLGRIERF